MRGVTRARAATAALAAVVVLGGAAAPRAHAKAPARCSPHTTVKIATGSVCGMTARGQTSYLDLRYAAPPTGARRWMPPAPARHLRGTYPATRRGRGCASPAQDGGLEKGSGEDCLFLEVQEPAHVAAGRALPVMVEMHGGGFIGEYRDDDGRNFVRGPAIYVYVGYRIGILGFLAHSALGAHSGDYGLMDQQAALRWVKANIAHFGGNAGEVTIFGESAGGASVCDQVASPTAKGLFQRGISISGFYNFNVNTIWSPADCKSRLQTEPQAQRSGARFAKAVGCDHGDVAACLRRVPTARLVSKGGSVLAPFRAGSIGPIANGTTLPQSAAQIFAEGRENKVPLIIGVGEDEFNGGVYTNSKAGLVVANTMAQYRKLVRTQFGSHARRVMAMYPPARFAEPSPFIAYRTIMADQASVCPALETMGRLAAHIPTYAYQDDDTASPPDESDTLPLGANHSAINRLAHDAPKTLDPNQLVLQNEVLDEWGAFARTGNPNAAGTPRWPRYTAAGNPVLRLKASGNSAASPTAAIRAQHHCGFWDALNRDAPWSVPAS